MFKTALSAGVLWNDIGGMTVEEVSLAAQARQEQYMDFIKALAWLLYNNAALTAVGFNDPKKFPDLEEAFPSLFERKEQQDWWMMKERIEQHAKRMKEK